MTEKDNAILVNSELEKVQKYLKSKRIFASKAEIILTAIAVARRLGAGDWTFACAFRHRGEQEK